MQTVEGCVEVQAMWNVSRSGPSTRTALSRTDLTCSCCFVDVYHSESGGMDGKGGGADDGRKRVGADGAHKSGGGRAMKRCVGMQMMKVEV